MLDHELKEYLQTLIPKRDEFFNEMEQYAKLHQVPIMDPLSMEALLQLLRLYKPDSVLEIGTAIGYSALRMASVVKGKIVTIERDQIRHEEAVKNIRRAKKDNQIQVLFGDAFNLVEEVKKYAPYDCLFIDAAKGQYQRFFEVFEPLLSENGIIITDNVLFRGYVYNPDQADQKRLKKVAEKINGYNQWLINHPSYHTVILPIGDGIAISIRKSL